MATQEKLHKSLDALSNLSNSNPNPSYDLAKKKEKIHHFHVITEAISNPSIKVAQNFQQLLSNTIEIFLKLCDDPEADVRMTSEECLNRIIRAVSDENIGKVQIDLHKEIKRNGAPRSLRAALTRFAQLAHLIRPHKGKAYVANLFPSLVKIAQRTEEQIHETLASSLPKIVKVLGCFSPDNQIIGLLKAFLSNISSSSAVIRRTSSSCILSVCLNCRKPSGFLGYCLDYLLDLLVPVSEENDEKAPLILGVMTSLKSLLGNLRSFQTEGFPLSIEKLLQIYELCLHYLLYKDHNIINACLETLNILLVNAPADFKRVLLCETGVGKSRITKFCSMRPSRFSSQLSVATNADDGLLGEVSELTDTLHSDIEKWIELSVLTSNASEGKSREDLDKSQSLDSGSVNITDIETESDYSSYTTSLPQYNLVENSDKLTNTSDHSSEKSCSVAEQNPDEFFEVDIGDYLDKSVSLLYTSRIIVKTFLLTGHPSGCVPDKTVRVSVKSLALTCLSSISQIYPRILVEHLDKNRGKSASNQQISDVLLFGDHADPQLRGIVRMLIAGFIKAVLGESGANFNGWLSENCVIEDESLLGVENLLRITLKGLEDESSNCTRQALTSLRVVLNQLLESYSSSKVVPILYSLLFLAKNPYWLVKVELCELLVKLPYVTIFHVMGNSDFQARVINNVLFEMLKDGDQRVRSASAGCLVEIIPNLYNEQYNVKETYITTKAVCYRNLYLKNLCDKQHKVTNLNRKHFIDNLPFPYKEIVNEACDSIEYSLSKIVSKLYNFWLKSTSKHFISGCIETLSLLSNTYPSTLYRNSWISVQNGTTDKIPELLNLCVNLLQNSALSYEITTQIHLINLTSNLYAGQSLELLRPVPQATEDTNPNPLLWDMFPSGAHAELSEQFLVHLVRLLNIFHHVLNEIVPVHPSLKNVLPSLPSASTLSPIKRRKSDLDKKMLSPGVKLDKDETGGGAKKFAFGYFLQSQHYMRIYEVLKNAFTNYKISLESEASQKFLELLRRTVQGLSVMMEIGTLVEFGRIAEELLGYLRTIFTLDSCGTVECVQQLLKCLFGTNLTANEGLLERTVDEDNSDGSGFYYNVSQCPYNDMSNCINSLRMISKVDDGDSTVMGYLHRKDVKKCVNLTKSSEKTLASYIRIFEPMVIKSLKKYTITSDVQLQCRVLQLLSQLVQLRVNYCLLDSEQVFIGFVFKQFTYIEEGQIPYSSELIPKIFQFLVQLSYSKQHSKCIISVPKIIQLCDGLMASGQSPLTHCIPALEPIVEDIFLTRNKTNTGDIKELETTREVVLSMLLRLCEHHEVLELITLILEESKCCSDKWLRWSKQVVAVVFPMLKQNKLRLDNSEAFLAFRRFIFALEPTVLQPLDEVVKILFQEPPSSSGFVRWLSKILGVLLVVSTVKEDVFLGKIHELKGELSPRAVFEHVATTADPLNVTNSAGVFHGVSPEIIVIKFVFRVVELIGNCVRQEEEHLFLIEQFSKFLMFCLQVFQSGSHCKIANEAISLVCGTVGDFSETVDKVNEIMLGLAVLYPTLIFQWCYFLTLLNYSNMDFWGKVLQDKTVPEESLLTPKKHPCINLEIMKVGGAIVFCDYLTENFAQTNQTPWLLQNNVHLLVDLSEEAPVSELINCIHRNAALSKLFIENIAQNCLEIDEPVFKVKLLKCVENCHGTQVGAVLDLLLGQMLSSRLSIALTRLVANLASRKIELLLTLSMEEVNGQLSKENLMKIKKQLVNTRLVKKHEALISLLNKLSTQYYDLSPLEFDQRRVVNPEYIKRLQINRTWYLSQVQARYNDATTSRETAKLLNHLEYNEIVNFMHNSEFNKSCLKDCIQLGVQTMKNRKGEVPVIIQASVDCLLGDLARVQKKLPENHQVFNPFERSTSTSEVVYTTQLKSLFRDDDFFQLLSTLAPSVSTYLLTLQVLPPLLNSSYEHIVKFAVLCLEATNNLIAFCDKNSLNIHLIDSLLTCSDSILKQWYLCGVLAQNSHKTWLCSAVNSIYKLISFLLRYEGCECLPSLPKYNLSKALEDVEGSIVAHACHQLYILVSWLHESKSGETGHCPEFLLKPLKSSIVSLARLTPVNSYVLVPVKVWSSGWQPEMSGIYHTEAPSLPIEFLQEVDVLEEFIFRITLLGWTSRQQFEETWMCLLSVLCIPTTQEVNPAELNDIVHGSSLAIKAITSLLLQTLYDPIAGNSSVSQLMHVSRDVPIKTHSISVKKLKAVQDVIQHKFEETARLYKDTECVNVFNQKNFEKTSSKYSYGQICVRYLLLAAKVIDVGDEDSFTVGQWEKREKLLEQSGLDINSCLQFLVDYYTQLMKPQSMTNIRVLLEAVRSTVIISDLFTDKSQFSWMLDVFLELSKLHAVEDQILHQYLIVGICKAIAVLTPDLEIYEQIKKILVQYLKSPFLPARIACLHGLLYILEGCKLSNISIGGISDEMQLILPCAVEYVLCHLNTTNGVLKKSKEHTHLVWSLAFYIIENVDEVHIEQNFVSNALQAAFTMLQMKFTNSLHKSIMKGLERLVIVKKSIKDSMSKQFLKLALDKMKHDNPAVAVRGTQLLLSYMYTDCAKHLETTETSGNVQTSPDHLVQTIENLSAIFERIKKGYVFEVEVLSSVLPTILEDFFAPSDILTKVIGEFLSAQQPHPKFLAWVVFQIFECAIKQEQLQLLQDWVVFSLSNFTQSLSIGMATWCLTCFFISASTNEWLRSLFPYVQTRVGRYEYEDKKMLCIAGADFYKNLSTDNQKQTFVDNFNKVKDQPDMPFNDLLNSL